MVKKLTKRYVFFLIVLGATILITIFSPDTGFKAFDIAGSSFMQMLSVLPPIMILLGLMDVWVPRETMIKFMGEDSGLLGIALAILLGSVAAGPMYAAFPFTAVLLRKGVKFSNIIIFMNAWCVTKIPTLLFELAYLGYTFTFVRFLINLPGIIIMGFLTQWLLAKDELKDIYTNSNNIN
jgi:uncharacterized membrane protein YraQ (UPF0718 family)